MAGRDVELNELPPGDPRSTANRTPTDDEDISERIPALGALAAKSFRGVCNRKQVYKRFPIISWLPSYSWGFLVEDMVAGLSVGLTVIPQGIAYAVIASLDPQYGLYSAFMGCFVYCIFGSCKDVTIGPTAIMSLMVQVHAANLGPDFAILSAFLTGCAILLLGILNLGFLVQFISLPVTAGFTSAAAITIASGQMKSLLGLPGKSNEFLESWINVFEHIGEVRLWDSVLGIGTIVVLLLLMNLKNIKGGPRWSATAKYVALARNAIVVIIGSVIAFLVTDAGHTDVFLLTGNVTSGLPPLQPPPFTATVGDREYSFTEMVEELGTSLIALPLIAILESIAIAKAFSKGKSIDATQEMIALGLCNIAGSFVSSMPVTGSFTRSAVNNNSGVRTPLGGVITGVLVLLALGLLTSTFYYIPKATLAGVIIAAMLFMVEFHAATEIWRTKRIDIIPMVVTLVACLFLGLEYGMVVGIAINFVFVLYQTSRPKISWECKIIDSKALLIVTPDQSLVYSCAEYLKHQVIKTATKEAVDLVVLDGTHISSVDSTSAKVLVSMAQDLLLQNRTVIVWKWKRSPRCTLLRLNREVFQSCVKNEENLEGIVKEMTSTINR
ncbi:sodium-independent sulfate anion transporter-like [Anopheles aquasalis]|uniref:sodium-independent sulfate anion transporter-like n=1 Tax=Anopheles aquasalis TaxID=42839 RepID=UPI00215A2A7F|nr:sodium-independent sulfate anion transporter-like [Anopheles aquasalis]